MSSESLIGFIGLIYTPCNMLASPIPSRDSGERHLTHHFAPCPAAGRTVRFPQSMKWRDKIVSDPQVLRGKPCIKGTRIPIPLVLGYLAAGRGTEDILKEFPDLTAEDVAACLDYARDLAEFEAVRP